MRANLNLSSARFCVLAILSLLLGCGGAIKPFPPPPPPAGSEFLFATSNNQVSTFSINTNTGALAAPVTSAGPSSSGSILVSPSGKFVYVSSAASAAVDIFSFTKASGVLTPISGSPFSIGAIAFGMAMDPTGKFLYVVNGLGNSVLAFTVNSSTGTLTAVAGSPFPTANGPTKAVVDPSGQFLFVSDNLDPLGGVSAYTINSTSGALTVVPGSPFTTLLFGGPEALAVHPSGKFLYVADFNSNAIVGLSISNTGSLTTVLGSPFATGSRPASLALDPAGKFLYAVNSVDKTFSAYTINATTGTPTAVTGSPFAAGAASGALAVEPSGKFLYEANSQLSGASTITGFNINTSSGALTTFSGQPFAAGNGSVTLTVASIP
jgi:6-phosphogluconolactonase